MSNTPGTRRPRVLAVGALERDNFGDLLYALLLQEILPDVELSLGAPIEPRVELPFDLPVLSWRAALSDSAYDGVWAVGGEIGATPPQYAYLTAFGVAANDELAHSDDDEWQSRLAASMGGIVLDPPYIPRPSAFPDNASAALVINSVGLSGIATAPEWRRPTLVSTIREASFVSVRDRASSDLLTELEIPHDLAPDLAHIVASIRPQPRDESGPVLVHLSEHGFLAHDHAAWAKTLTAAIPDPRREIRLFLAGLAPAHDTVDSARKLRDAVRAEDPRRTVSISEARWVWDRVDEIAASSLWIGNSLHGRIVASAYGVPRISLAKPKVDAYARDWDPDQPWGVSPADLASAVERAWASPTAPATDLASQARESAERAADSLASPPGADADLLAARLVARAEEARALAALGRSLTHRANRLDAEVTRTREALGTVRGQLAQRDGELARIRSSRRWRFFERIDRFRWRVRGVVRRLRRSGARSSAEP